MTSYTIPNLTLYDADSALPALRADIAQATEARGWSYMIDPAFLFDLFYPFQPTGQLRLIVDNTQRFNAARVTADWPGFHAYTWSINRTMHDKTLLFPQLDVTWIGTMNLTRGSYTMSRNRALRIHNRELLTHLLTTWHDEQLRCLQVRIPPPAG